MEFRDLNYLIAIYEEKSISKAAERLYMAQSSLSQSLSVMEQQVNARMFIRTSSGVRPTEAGRIMIKYAYEMLTDYHEVRDQIQDLHELKGGSVIMGISSFRGSYLLPPVLNAFHMEYPDIHVKIIEANSMTLEQKLLTGDLDIAMIVLPVADSRIQAEKLMKDEICLITSSSHPALRKARRKDTEVPSETALMVDLKDLMEYEFLLSDYDTILGREARRLFAKNGLTPITYNETMTALFAAAMAAAGQGISFTYYSSRHYFRNAAFLSLAKEESYIDLAIALAPGRYHSKAALALKEVIFLIMKRSVW